MVNKLYIKDLEIHEYPSYYTQYFDVMDNSLEIFQAYKYQISERENLLKQFQLEGKLDFAYAKGKWTVSQVFSHTRDSEVIMNYRALCIARGESQPIPGFDENIYQGTDKMINFNVEAFLQQARLQTEANILLYQSFSEEDLLRTGISNSYPVSVRGLIAVVYAHEKHHLGILKSKYL